jgi:hypothetical protein
MGQPAVMLASSDDMGLSWDHKIVSHYSTNDNEQNLGSAALSVNKNGIVGVTWNEPLVKKQRFAISQNGGASFELPITFSNGTNLKFESSQFFENQLQTMGTFEPDASSGEPAGAHADGIGLSIRILPAASSAIELSSDANGNFHPFWTEQQSMGILSLFTTTIQITKETGMFQKVKPDLKTFKNVNAKVIVDVWKQQYDANAGEFILDFTLTNKSDSVVVGPVFIELSKIVGGYGFGDPKLINEDAIDYMGKPVLDVSKILIGGKLKPDMQTLKYTILFKIKQNTPTEKIWQKVQEGETIHPISCQFNIYARIE